MIIQNLSFRAGARDPEKACAPFGRVVAVDVPAVVGAPAGGRRLSHRGFGFVTFGSAAEARAAAGTAGGLRIRGRDVRIEMVVSKDKHQWTQVAAQPPPIEDGKEGDGSDDDEDNGSDDEDKDEEEDDEEEDDGSDVEGKQKDEKGQAPSKGYGFVEFAEHAHALACLRELNNNPHYAEEYAVNGARVAKMMAGGKRRGKKQGRSGAGGGRKEGGKASFEDGFVG